VQGGRFGFKILCSVAGKDREKVVDLRAGGKNPKLTILNDEPASKETLPLAVSKREKGEGEEPSLLGSNQKKRGPLDPPKFYKEVNEGGGQMQLPAVLIKKGRKKKRRKGGAHSPSVKKKKRQSGAVACNQTRSPLPD